MPDTIGYFGNPVPATYPNGDPIIVNGRRLLIPENFSLQNEINAAHAAASRPWWTLSLLPWAAHYALGASGDPQRQAGYSGGFDPTYTDAGNYAFALSAAAAGFSLERALNVANWLNQGGTGKALPAINESAIRQGFRDYAANRFPSLDDLAGSAYLKSVWPTDTSNAYETLKGIASKKVEDFVNKRVGGVFGSPRPITESDVQRYAKARWGDLNSPDAKEFMANFKQAFGGYPQHVDIEQLHPLPADGNIPSGKDVSLFVGRNGEVLRYARPPAPGGAGALRGIYGLDGGPNGAGSTGLDFFRDGTPKPTSVRPHPATPSDPTGGIDVTLPNGAEEHWSNDPIDGFIRRQLDYAYSDGGYDTPSERLGHVPTDAKPAPPIGRQIADPSVFDTGASAVPFVPATDPLAPQAPAQRSLRKSGSIFPMGSSSRSIFPVPSVRSAGSTQTDPRSGRSLRDRLVTPGSEGSRNEDAFAPGIAAGQPRRDDPFSPNLALPDPSAASGNDIDD